MASPSTISSSDPHAHPLVERRIANDVVEVDIPAAMLMVPREEVIRSLGYPAGAAPDHLLAPLAEVLAEVPRRCVVRAGYRVAEVRSDPANKTGLSVGNIFFRMQPIVTRFLRNSDRAAVFLCTIGAGMETWSDEVGTAGDLFGAYLIDTVASLAAESATDLLHDHISSVMQASGVKVTNRYSPGYCDWSVKEQHELFSLFPPGFCDITLLPSSLMVPMKSTSGVIGIGPDVAWERYLCDSCGMKDCTYRSLRAR